MDQRTQQCKQLKKAYKKERRRRLWIFNAFTWLGLTVTVIAAVFCIDIRWFGGTLCAFVDESFWNSLREGSVLAAFGCQVQRLGYWFVLGGSLLTIFFGGLLFRRSKKLHRDPVYLDWRTLKTALDTEKKEEV